MNQVSTVGLDLAKHIFQLHGADSAGVVVFRKKLRRGQLLVFLATLPPCTVAMEACASAHYWGREIAKLGCGPVHAAHLRRLGREGAAVDLGADQGGAGGG
jgi:transposase